MLDKWGIRELPHTSQGDKLLAQLPKTSTIK